MSFLWGFLWEIFHQAQHVDEQLRTKATTLRQGKHALESTIRAAEQQIDRLTLAVIAMAEIMRDRLGVAEKEIETKIQEIDLRDNKADRKFRPRAKRCKACGRISAAVHADCIYCGATLAGKQFPLGS